MKSLSPTMLALLGVGGAMGLVGVAWYVRGPHPNFTWAELTRTSSTGDNSLTMPARKALHRLTWTVLAPLRREFGPLRINSGYRSPIVNSDIGGSSSSSHMALSPAGDEAAVDVQTMDPATQGTNWDIAAWLYDNGGNMGLDQVIAYHDRTHAHVGISPRNRQSFLQHNAGNYSSWSPS